MWISGGDHELAENIAHLVLAKLPGSPPGVKGISLFIVPRFRVDRQGRLREWNNISLAGLNHKMGQRATTNCLLNFGENGDSLGTLVGEPHLGLTYMFHMMNEARIGVGMSSAMSALAGYRFSLEYARSRPICPDALPLLPGPVAVLAVSMRFCSLGTEPRY
jgi:butyryl-CoA dehydrogenase